jgi:hypothetical protein
MVSRRGGGGGEKVLKNRNDGGRKYGGHPRWESKMRRGSFSFTLSGVGPKTQRAYREVYRRFVQREKRGGYTTV